MLDHSVTVPGKDIALTSKDMTGMLYVPDQTDVQRQLCASHQDAVDSASGGQPTIVAPCYLPPQKAVGNDYFSVGLLLAAMGVNLTEIRPDSPDGKPRRYDGLVASIVIEYSNTMDWHGLQPTTYVYKITAIPGSSYKEFSLVSTKFPDTRVKKSLHGILMSVQPGGKLAVFDFTQMLLQVTASLTLLAMATLGVNILAQYVLRQRAFYKAALYDRTADLGNLEDLGDVNQLRETFLEEELSSRNLPTHGSKVQRVLRLLENGWEGDREVQQTQSQDGSHPPRSAFGVGRSTV